MSFVVQRLPLFPLQTVLMPGGTLPLHIFEPRYRAMIKHCLDGDRRFGVVLIAEGVEVGGQAIPHQVGTIAVIQQAEPQADGRYFLVTTGAERFSIQQTWLEPSGYLMGELHLRPEVIDITPSAMAELVSQLRQELIALIGQLAKEPAPLNDDLAQMADPVRLSGMAATLLQTAPDEKQQLLELDSLPTRLGRLIALLRRERRLIEMLTRSTSAPLKNDIVSPN